MHQFPTKFSYNNIVLDQIHNKVFELIIYTQFFFLFFVASNRVGGWNGLILQPKYQTFMTVAVS